MKQYNIFNVCVAFFLSIFLLSAFVTSAPLPAKPAIGQEETSTLTPQDITIIDNIQTEGKLNRKFTSDELTRQREQMLNAIDDRVVYYEKEFNNMVDTAVLKLGLLWGGIVLFITGLNTFVLRKLERKRFKMLRDALLKEINPMHKTLNTDMMDKFKQDEEQAKKMMQNEINMNKDNVEQHKSGEFVTKPKPEGTYYQV